MAWILVPLQYLFLIWKAEIAANRARAARGHRSHVAKLSRAERAVLAVEIFQLRFPAVIAWVDMRRRRTALANQYKV